MNARMIVLACLLATVGVPARSAAVVLAPTTVDVYTLEFEPTQNARPGSSGVMTIKILDGGATDFFSLRIYHPHTIHSPLAVFIPLGIARRSVTDTHCPSARHPAYFDSGLAQTRHAAT